MYRWEPFLLRVGAFVFPFVAVPILIVVANHRAPEELRLVLFLAILVGQMIAGAAAQQFMVRRPWPCPRCRKPFLSSDRWWTQCASCGLPAFSVTDPGPTEPAATLGVTRAFVLLAYVVLCFAALILTHR